MKIKKKKMDKNSLRFIKTGDDCLESWKPLLNHVDLHDSPSFQTGKEFSCRTQVSLLLNNGKLSALSTDSSARFS